MNRIGLDRMHGLLRFLRPHECVGGVMSLARVLSSAVALTAACLIAPNAAHAIAVASTVPAGNANNVERAGSIAIHFDGALSTSSITSSSFRVWGQESGPAQGTTAFSDADQTLTFTPSSAFFPGEWISVQLSHDIAGADESTLRSAGYAFQFLTKTAPGSNTSTELPAPYSPVSVSLNGDVARLYGGAITDLNHDGWIDFIAVNEVSHDLRVLLNTADGTGHLGPVLTPPAQIGVEASPSTVADFNNDGFMDVATGNSTSNTVSIALGSGDGHFSSVQDIPVGARPHGVVALDVDGDGDLDLVVASENDYSLWLMINDGQGVFGSATEFASSTNDGRYALGAGDMNGDGIIDLVVGTTGVSGAPGRILVLAGNGDGTFTQTEDISSGGYGWKLALGDVNNDGYLDVAQANGYDNNGSILFGNGDGTLQSAQMYSFNGSGAGSSLGDLDGDGYLDWVVSSYTAGEWYVMHNNGDGTFTRVQTIPAPLNASCASLYDFDNNGTLDMALADESADVIVLMRNDGGTTQVQADVAIAMSGDPAEYTPGDALTYTITLTNSGPDAAASTSVTDAFPAAFTNASWTCAASGGASCTASGSGSIDQLVNLPVGGEIVYTVTGTVAQGTSGVLTNTASATVGAPVIDPATGNNTATVSTPQAAPQDLIFKSGFDG